MAAELEDIEGMEKAALAQKGMCLQALFMCISALHHLDRGRLAQRKNLYFLFGVKDCSLLRGTVSNYRCLLIKTPPIPARGTPGAPVGG